jgi:flagellin
VQAASDTIGPTERGFVDREYQSLKQEIDRISNVTKFNGTELLNGKAGIIDIQVGIQNNPLLDRITYSGEKSNASLEALGLTGESVATKEGAQTSLSAVDDALVKVNSVRADLGAMQNRLMSTMNSLSIADENLSAANSRVRDADFAQEVSEMTKQNILMQAGTSVLSQANQKDTMVLKLLS